MIMGNDKVNNVKEVAVNSVMILHNNKEVIVIQGDKESVLATQKVFDINKYGMTLVSDAAKEVTVKHIRVNKGNVE